MINNTIYCCVFFFIIGNSGICQNSLSDSYADYENGEHTEYYSNGKIYAQFSIENGKLQGERIFYFRNGKHDIYSFHDNGHLHGNLINYNKNGDTKGFTELTHDSLLYHVEISYYFLSRKIKHYNTYEFIDSLNENMIGNLEYSPLQKYTLIDIPTICSETYNKTTFRSFHRNGTLALNAEGVSNQYSGSYFEYYKNGNIKTEATCSENKWNGVTIIYDKKEKIKKKAFYSNGEMIRNIDAAE